MSARSAPGEEVAIIAANPAAGVEPIRRTAKAAGDGAWRAEDLLLVPAGQWSVEVEALVSDFEKVMFETVVDLN